MKKTIFKESLREISNTKKRFFSIVIIVLLGVGFFCGVKATSPDMKNNLNKYFKSNNYYDVEVISTFGLDNNDVNELKKISDVYNVTPSISFDTYANVNDNEIVFKVHEYLENINRIILIDGKLPTNEKEVVVEESFLKKNNYKIGDTIELILNDDNIKLNNNVVTIVGSVNSPMYISKVRGSSKLGIGTINYYMYMNSSNIKSDYYTEVFLNVKNEEKLYSQDYKDLIKKYKTIIEKNGKLRSEERYNEIIKEYDDNISNVENKINTSKKELTKQINIANNKIKNSEKELIELKELKNTYNNINDDYQKLIFSESLKTKGIDIANIDYLINTYEKEISNAKKELFNSKNNSQKEITKAEQKLEEVKKDRNDIKTPKWYVLGIESNPGFTGYLQDTDRIANIGKVFPIVFFVVAALICLTSMTRMVEEERGMIGTLKSLGYSEGSIAFKYVLYALLATIIGSVLGMIIGFNTIPYIISNVYTMMYTIPKIDLSFVLKYAIGGSLAATISTVGATYFTVKKSLNEKPAELLRPVSPKPGKRVWLERITFIWKRLKFTKKVTVRNLFRYKKKFLMTIIGITGCTSLILAGFGLRDSIGGIIPLQYGKIFKYNLNVTLKTDNLKDINIINNELKDKEYIKDTLLVNKQSVDIINKDNNQIIALVIPENNINSFIGLSESLTDDKVLITTKLSKLLNINVGDTLKIKDNDDKVFNVIVGGITENYVYHFIYMSKNNYEKTLNKDFIPNDIYVLSDDISKKEEDSLSKDLLKDKNIVSSITYAKSTEVSFKEVMDNMQVIANILIISAGLLAIVVLYNLANVNISERKRELATIKVLGFFDKEVYKYVTREVVILTIIGIVLGIFGGNILTTFIVKTCELDMLIFKTNIKLSSYIYAVILTSLFTIIVNYITYFMLKKIDMIESLKSIE